MSVNVANCAPPPMETRERKQKSRERRQKCSLRLQPRTETDQLLQGLWESGPEECKTPGTHTPLPEPTPTSEPEGLPVYGVSLSLEPQLPSESPSESPSDLGVLVLPGNALKEGNPVYPTVPGCAKQG